MFLIFILSVTLEFSVSIFKMDEFNTPTSEICALVLPQCLNFSNNFFIITTKLSSLILKLEK